MSADIKKLLDEAFKFDEDIVYAKTMISHEYIEGAEAWHEHVAPLAIEIIVELWDALKFECYCLNEKCDACETLAKVEARLRGKNE